MPKQRLQCWPYIPSQPEWKLLPWDAARTIDSRVTGFVGHDDDFFFFQIRGVDKAIKVAKVFK